MSLMEISGILNHFPRKVHFVKYIFEVIVKYVRSSFSLFSGKKCFSSRCSSSVTKETESTLFQRIKIDQKTQTISEMFHGGPWFLESSFLEIKKHWLGNKNVQYLFYITRGLRAIWSTTDHIRPLISSTSQLSETSLTEEFGDLKQSPLFDGPLWKTSPLYLH